MKFELRPAQPEDAAACVALRGKTRQNAISEDQLRALGVTETSWSVPARRALKRDKRPKNLRLFERAC